MTHLEQDYAASMRSQGYRLTPQREIILDTLCELGGHVPVTVLVEAVRKKASAIDRATVYRTVSFFTELGMIASTEIDGVSVVEIAPEQESNHGHLVCRGCGYIVHVPADLYGDLSRQLEEDYGFATELQSLTIEGLCAECKLP